MSICTCLRCRTTDDPADTPTVHEPIHLPDAATPFRVHYADGRPPRDHVLHPTGQVTTVILGEVWRSLLGFDAMREMSWEDAHIEWNPSPLPTAAEEAAPVQDALLPAA